MVGQSTNPKEKRGIKHYSPRKSYLSQWIYIYIFSLLYVGIYLTCHESTLRGWIWCDGWSKAKDLKKKKKTIFIAILNPENPHYG